jgi:murein tripeptide amidase MpaA
VWFCIFIGLPLSVWPQSRKVLRLSHSEYVQASKIKGLDVYSQSSEEAIIIVSENEFRELKALGIKSTVVLENTQNYLAKPGSEVKAALEDFHSYERLAADLNEFAQNDFVELGSLGQTAEGREIYAAKLGYVSDDEKPAMVIVALTHAREWIGMEVATFFIEFVVANSSREDIDAFLRSIDIWVIPAANPDGLEYTRENDRFWRKNRSPQGEYFGVDINRNFDFNFEVTDAVLPESETYRGPSAASELETQALATFIADVDVRALVDLHSFGQFILYPWAYTTDPSDDDVAFQNLAESFADNIFSVFGSTYQVGQPSNVLSSANGNFGGTLMDYVYDRLDIPAFAMELRPDSGGNEGFEITLEQAYDNYQELEFMFLALAEIVKNDTFPSSFAEEDSSIELADGCGW